MKPFVTSLLKEQVQSYSQKMVQGHLSLLSLCPQEVAHLRKELLIAAKHILATDLRNSNVSIFLCKIHVHVFFFNYIYDIKERCKIVKKQCKFVKERCKIIIERKEGVGYVKIACDILMLKEQV